MSDKHSLEQRLEQLREARMSGNQEAEGRSLRALGDCYFHEERWQEAAEHFSLALAIFQQRGAWEEEGNTLLSLGHTRMALQQPQVALSAYEAALAIARTHRDALLEACSLLTLGNVQRALERPAEAIDAYQNALACLDESEGEDTLRWHLYDGLGHAYLSLRQWDQARESFEQNLALARALGSSRHEARTLSSLAQVFFSMDGEAERGLDCLRQAVTLFRSLGDQWQEARILADLGENRLRFRANGQHVHEGIEALHTAYERASQIGDQALLSYVLHAQGRASIRRSRGMKIVNGNE